MPESKAKIELRVQPNAPRNKIVSLTDGVLQVKIGAPPVRGKANDELISFLSKHLGVSRSALTIVTGYTSRNKVITVDGLSQEEVIQRLSPS